MKGIILAGGTGSRLNPITKVTNKALLPIYDKPMIYYSICTLMNAGVKDIMIIACPTNYKSIQKLLGDGSQFGVKFSYKNQKLPMGAADAFKKAKEFIVNRDCVLIFADNLFFGKDMKPALEEAKENLKNGFSSIFCYEVDDPTRFGIVEMDKEGRIISIEEKPEKPKSNNAQLGLFFFKGNVCEKFNHLTLSARGEYEITNITDMFLKEGTLKGIVLNKENYWYDTGTLESMYEASTQVRNFIQSNNGLNECPEQIAYSKGWISKKALEKFIQQNNKNDYAKSLRKLIDE